MREKGGGFEMEGLNPSTNYGLCNISKKNRVIKIMFCMMVSMKVFYKLIVLFLVFFIYLFILIGIHSMQGSTATMRHGVTRKRSTKRLEHTENLFRKNLQLKDVC